MQQNAKILFRKYASLTATAKPVFPVTKLKSSSFYPPYWILSTDIANIEDLRQNVPGTITRVETNDGRPVGVGILNSHASIGVRMLNRSNEKGFPIDDSYFSNAVRKALRRREELYPGKRYYRAINGESDGLPDLEQSFLPDTTPLAFNPSIEQS